MLLLSRKPPLWVIAVATVMLSLGLFTAVTAAQLRAWPIVVGVLLVLLSPVLLVGAVLVYARLRDRGGPR